MNNHFKQIKPKTLTKKRSVSVSKNNSNVSSIKKIIENKKSKIFSQFNTIKNKSPNKSNKKTRSRNNSASNLKRTNSFFKERKSKTVELESNKQNKNYKKVLQNAKELLTEQNNLLNQFSELTKEISKSELELQSKIDKSENNNFNLDNFIDEFIKNQNNKKCLFCIEKDNFFIEKLNELNGFIGELGYNYIFHKFKSFNYNNENICIYFKNLKNLISLLNKQFCEMKYILSQQEEEIKNKNLTIEDLNKQLNEFQENSSQMNKNNNGIILENSTSSLLSKLSNQNLNYDNQEDNNYDNKNFIDYNQCSFGNLNKEKFEIINNNSLNRKIIERNRNNLLNENRIHNNISQSSNLFDSETFFEGYKRNKEMRLELEHHYTEENENKNNYK